MTCGSRRDPGLSRRGSAAVRSAFAVSSAGDWIYRFAVPTLILHLTGSAVATGLAYVLEFLPYVVIGPFAGVFADRFSRRATLVGCDAASCAVALGLAAVARLPHPPVFGLYGGALALACLRPLYFPAYQGFLVEAVSEDVRPRFNSWTHVTDSLLGLAGPVAGTAVVAAAGAPAATVIDAASFAASAALVAAISRPRAAARPRPGGRGRAGRVLRDLAAGARAMTISPVILAGTAAITGANLAAYIIEGNLVFLVLHVEHQPKVALGAVLSAQGLGGVLGAAAAPRLLGRSPAGRLIAAGLGLSAAGMLMPAAFPRWAAIVAGQGIEGGATALIVVCWFSVLQRLVPADVIGRFVAVGRAAAYATIPAGTIIGAGLVSTAAGVRVLFGGAAALQSAVFIAAARSSLRRADPADWPGPEPAAGPVPAARAEPPDR